MSGRIRHRSLLKSLVVGTTSGLLGTVAMTQFQNLWNQSSEKIKPDQNANAGSVQSEEDNEDSTMKVAGKIAQATGHRLSKPERKSAGLWVHYGFGAAVGGIFGLLKEIGPRRARRLNPVLAGAGYGTAVFLGAHEVAVPALKLSSSPFEEPVSDQVLEYLAHLIYG